MTEPTACATTRGPLAFVPEVSEILEGPWDVGVEQRWRVRLSDGRRAVVAQLAADLAQDISIRRRYVGDLERLVGLDAHSLVPTLVIGPAPDPRAHRAVPPFRVRLDPDGEPLDGWLRRAPAPLDEVATVFAGVADAIHAVHVRGGVLRDLRPEHIVRTPDGRTVLLDVGLARVDVLSSHTASSLLLQGSSYAAPEQLHRTAVDQRSDVYAVGTMMWQALTGELPFGDGPAFFTERHELPSLSHLRADIPEVVDRLVRKCLAEAPADRPSSITEIAWVLRGGASRIAPEETTVCQHCGAGLTVGQRLCLRCGRIGIRFHHVGPGEEGYGVDLLALREEADQMQWLRDFLQTVSQPPMRPVEFLTGSVHLYSNEEKAGRLRLPTRLFGNLTRETAIEIRNLMAEHGLETRLVSPHDVRKAALAALGTIVAATAIMTLLVGLFGLEALWGLPVAIAAGAISLGRLLNRQSEQRSPPAFRLRPMPAALPASDPLVARLAALLDSDPPADVRDIVGQMALLVQRLVDHRAQTLGQAHEIDVLTAPVEPLVAAVEDLVGRLGEIGRELRELDEGAMVRALAAAEARAEGPEALEPILRGLDRLRGLEDQRARIFHRLLEARTLLQRTVDLGLAVQDPVQAHERQVQLALATLTGDTSVDPSAR